MGVGGGTQIECWQQICGDDLPTLQMNYVIFGWNYVLSDKQVVANVHKLHQAELKSEYKPMWPSVYVQVTGWNKRKIFIIIWIDKKKFNKFQIK